MPHRSRALTTYCVIYLHRTGMESGFPRGRGLGTMMLDCNVKKV